MADERNPEITGKSYVCTGHPEYSRNDYTFPKVFDAVRKEKRESWLVNMDTGERVSNLDVLKRGEQFAKGLLTLGLQPGEDTVVIIGCPSFEALAIFVAAAELGLGFAQLFFHPPRAERMVTQLSMMEPKVIITGEGAGGHNFTALMSLFDTEADKPSSARLPFVEHIFYDSSYKDREPSEKFVKTLNNLRELGETVADEQLSHAKNNVKPDFIIQYLLTSGSTGVPKCASRTQESYVFFALQDPMNDDVAISMNMNVDTLASWFIQIRAIIGYIGKAVMIPETYEENPFKDQGRVLTEVIIKERVDALLLTMSTLTSVVAYITTNQIVLPHAMRTVCYGAQIISKQFMEDNEKLLKGVHVNFYGLTEAMMVGRSKPDELVKQKNFTNDTGLFAYKDMELRVADEQDKPVDIGEMGELQVKTPTNIKEYRGNLEKTRELFTNDGFLRTGDAAVMSTDGSFEVLGRMSKNDRFKIFGKVEYAGPIEAIFSKHPAIKDVQAVVGRCNDWIGDEITCCIIMKDQKNKLVESELLDFCKQNGMYARQRPARIVYFDKFPVTDNMRKTSKDKLTQQLKELISEDEELGKCSWFSELEKSGKTY